MRLRLSLITIIMALIISACAPHYACKTSMPGKRCASLSEVYEEEVLGVKKTEKTVAKYNGINTSNEENNSPAESVSKIKDNGISDNVALPNSTSPGETIEAKKSRQKNVDVVDVVKNLDYEEKFPILKPPKIIRIWISPWIDNNGDLNMGSYIYTEIEDKKWVIGEEILIKDVGSLTRGKIEKRYDILKK